MVQSKGAGNDVLQLPTKFDELSASVPSDHFDEGINKGETRTRPEQPVAR